jgi:hypothetical protein
LDLKLAGKIVKYGLEKGVRTDDFVILTLYFTGAVKDLNAYKQINTEIRWRYNQNLSMIKKSRFREMYEKATHIKKFWDHNKILPKKTIVERKSEERNRFDIQAS